MLRGDERAVIRAGGVDGSREVLRRSRHDRINWLASFLEPGVLTRFGLRSELSTGNCGRTDVGRAPRCLPGDGEPQPKEPVARKVIVSNIMSLDGYYVGSGGNVMVLPMDEAFDAYNLERIQAAGTVLLGRTSYQGFSSYWPHIADHPDEPEPDRAHSGTNRALSRIHNQIEKAVVSDSYTPEPDNPWYDTTTVVSRADARPWLTQRKQRDGGDILIYGSRTLWNSLLTDGLIDELHLMVGAVVLGGGTPLFSAPVDALTLLEARSFDGSHNVLLRALTTCSCATKRRADDRRRRPQRTATANPTPGNR